MLVVGLGNPGKKYEGTRHNLGFMIVDELRRVLSLPDFREKFSGVFCKGDRVSLLKPMTYMNLSGDSVQPCAAFLKLSASEVVVVHDEVDLPFGTVRIKLGGGHAGHNGLRSIIQRLGTADFVRVRAGVGRPPAGYRGEVADFLLSDFNTSERAELPDLVKKGLGAVEAILEKGAQAAMNAHNQVEAPRNSPPAAAPSADVHARLCEAIRKNRLLEMKYDGAMRVVEPHDYGLRKGASLVLGYQRTAKEGWRTYNAGKIQELKVLSEGFSGDRPRASEKPPAWDEIFGRAGKIPDEPGVT